MKIVSVLKNTIIHLVNSGTAVEDVVRHFHWTEAMMEEFGVKITAEFVAKALQGIYKEHAAGETTHAKKYARFDNRSAWSIGAMVGNVHNTSGAKIISFGRDNPSKGLPVSHADGILADKDTGVRRLTVECISGSDLRTGWFALVLFEIAFQPFDPVDIVIIGAGPIAAACILMLNSSKTTSNVRIKILCKNGKSNFALVKRLRHEVNIRISATNDRAYISQAQYVITATNAGVPVIANHEIAENAAVLSQGIDDLPSDYIQRLIDTKGKIIGDDLEAMEQRDVDPLSLYYSRQGKKLTVDGIKDGVITVGEIYSSYILSRNCRIRNCDIAFFPVGIIAYDISVNMAVEEALIVAIHNEAKNAEA